MEVRQIDVPNADVVQAGEGPDLLLVHSLLAERSAFDRALPELAKGHRVTIPNLPGYGGTPRLNNTTPDVREFADFLVGVMDAAELSCDTAVLGNGAGGFMCVALGIYHGERFGKLILADTGSGFPEPAKKPLHLLADRVEADGMGAVLDAAILRMFPGSYISANPDIVTERKEALAVADPAAFAATARALARVEMSAEIGRIENDTLVMVGLDDTTTPPDMSYALHQGISGAQLVEIPDCGHCPQIQSKDAFVRAVLEFIDR
ncbi:MAG: hypothetical protein CL573_09340 [Alphaproteobacteria bacterium]|nr:hypothetical protein [Alphaproteobacteria bacterium]HCP00322.1 hypothetical protein [Rhodospirillaceae bacterium]